MFPEGEKPQDWEGGIHSVFPPLPGKSEAAYDRTTEETGVVLWENP